MIAIIKYSAGNLASVQNALSRLGATSFISSDPEQIQQADKVIIPGVGAAAKAMESLKESGLDKVITDLKQPVLGICLGMQLLCKSSEEGDVPCLGIFDNEVKEFKGDALVPHMGWNDIKNMKGFMFDGIKEQTDMYFVHSYFVELGSATSAVCDYIQPFSAALQKDNFYATQFHPEKSSYAGRRLLQNFLEL